MGSAEAVPVILDRPVAQRDAVPLQQPLADELEFALVELLLGEDFSHQLAYFVRRRGRERLASLRGRRCGRCWRGWAGRWERSC